MYYIVSGTCIGERFLEDSFYWYSQQIISSIANKSLVLHNARKEHEKYCSTEHQPKPNKKM